MDYEKAYKQALELARQIKDGKDEWRYSDLTEIIPALTEIFPELAESEDERIMKDILRFLKAKQENCTAPTPAKSTLSMWIAYLEKQKEFVSEDFEIIWETEDCKTLLDEGGKLSPRFKEMFKEVCHSWYDKGIEVGVKQKEQKPLSTEETELNALAFLSQMDYTCIPPKKEHQNNSDAPEKALGGALNSPLDKDKNLDDIAQDYVEAVKEYNPEPTWDLMQTAVCYGYHYREGEEQKPVEWSPTKEQMVALSWAANDMLDNDSPSAGDIKASLRSLYNDLQSKSIRTAEWSEEDEDVLQNIIQEIEWERRNTTVDKDIRNYDRQLNFLKSLRPQPKRDGGDDYNKGYIKGRADTLKEFADISSWKPSEEQMGALRMAVNKLAKSDVADSVRLSIMYDNLKEYSDGKN